MREIAKRFFVVLLVFAAGRALVGDSESAIVVVAPLAPTGTSENDWQYRSNLDGVVWNHDFRAAAEVDQFRWTNGYGNDPLDAPGLQRPQNTIIRDTSDFLTGGGSLQAFRPPGAFDGKDWWRPFSPMAAPGNGKTTDDPADGGNLTLRTWVAVDDGNQTQTWVGGDYGPASEGVWDGAVFYFQLAMKLDPRRIAIGLDGGKIKYLTRTQRSLTAQELVTNYQNSVDFDIYKAGGQSTTSNVVPNFPQITDEWVHYLYQIGPGDELAPTTRIVVRRVRAGEKTYTTIYDAQGETIDYQDIDPKAWNATILGTYHNGFNLPEFWQKYDQLIFSKQYIPPPSTFSGSVLETAATALANGAWAADAIAFNPQSQAFDISWQNRTAFWDNENRELQYMGKAQSGGAARHFMYDEQTNTWRSPNLNVTPGKVGHIWTAAFDHTDDPGDYYHVEDGHTAAPARTRTIRHYSRSADTWTDLPLATFDIWSTDSPNPGAAYHPNLMGPGRPGLFAYSSVRFAWFDKLNQTWTQGANFGLGPPYGNRNHNSSLYIPGHDVVFFGSGRDVSLDGIVIPAGYGSAPSATPQLVPLPISVQSDINAGAHMLIDPRDSRTVMLLERRGNRVWTNNDVPGTTLASQWTLEAFTHPCWDNLPVSSGDGGSWTPASIPRYGVVWCAASNGGGGSGNGGSILWKPGS